jgi:gamma-glutamylcyclotransferase (GGCT)/AIG2-like uncharacterized protein YtfP
MMYFAYGANLHRAHMGRVAPGAALIGGGTVADHRVAIGRAGFGTLIPASGRVVHGLLWDLTERDERALDRFEGVDRDFYTKVVLAVTTAGGTVDAMVYLAVDARPGKASPDYVRHVVESAGAARFPADYLAELAGLPQDESAAGPWIPPGER